MREYGQIQCSYWTDPDIQGLPDVAKLLGAYLMTGPHSNGLGCYRLPNGYIQADLGWSSDTVSEGFQALSEIGFAHRCENTDFVVIPKFLRWNPVPNESAAKARIKEFEQVPARKFSYYSLLAQSLMKHGKHWPEWFKEHLAASSDTVSDTVSEDIHETVSECLPTTRPEQEQDQTRTEEPPDGGSSTRVASLTGPPPCPQKEIIELYHEILPELPQVRYEMWKGSQHEQNLRARWREDPKRQDLGYWRRFFQRIHEACPFLLGQGEPNPKSGKVFQASLRWIVKRDNFAKILEGHYTEKPKQGQAT